MELLIFFLNQHLNSSNNCKSRVRWVLHSHIPSLVMILLSNTIEQSQSLVKQTNKQTGNRQGLKGPISIHYSIAYTEDNILGSKVTYLRHIKKKKKKDHKDLTLLGENTGIEKVFSECSVIFEKERKA